MGRQEELKYESTQSVGPVGAVVGGPFGGVEDALGSPSDALTFSSSDHQGEGYPSMGH